MVAAAGTLQAPTIGLQQLDQLATLHRVYYTHDRCFGQSQLALESTAIWESIAG